MQNYGKFFNRPKRENQIVDNWRIVLGELFDEIHQHIFKP
jgi:hypothetical protein